MNILIDNLEPNLCELLTKCCPVELNLFEYPNPEDVRCQAAILSEQSTHQSEIAKLPIPLIWLGDDSPEGTWLQLSANPEESELVEGLLALSQTESNLTNSYQVLVVDDNELVMDSVCAILEEEFDVVGTTSALEGLALLENQEFDVLMTDLMMEEMHGNTLVKEALKRNEDLKIIVMTGYSSKEAAIEALKAGAFDYLEKPLLPSDVLQSLDKAFQAIQKQRVQTKELKRLREESIDKVLGFSQEEDCNRIAGESQLIESLIEVSKNNLVGKDYESHPLFVSQPPFIDGFEKANQQWDSYVCESRLPAQSLQTVLDQLIANEFKDLGVVTVNGSSQVDWIFDDPWPGTTIFLQIMNRKLSGESHSPLGIAFANFRRCFDSSSVLLNALCPAPGKVQIQFFLK